MNEGKKQQRDFDEIQTPKYAVDALLKIVDVDGKIVWEPTADRTSNGIVQSVEENGGTAKISRVKNFDFISHEPDVGDFDIIITNPPYSKKNEFIRRCYEIGKPFAILLPITSLETSIRGKMFRENGVQLLVLDRRVNFTGGKGSWFNVSWFCWNLLPRDLMFTELKVVDRDVLFKRERISQVWD